MIFSVLFKDFKRKMLIWFMEIISIFDLKLMKATCPDQSTVCVWYIADSCKVIYAETNLRVVNTISLGVHHHQTQHRMRLI